MRHRDLERPAPSSQGVAEVVVQAVKVFGPGDLRIVEDRLGSLAQDRVRLRFRAGGICGSDMHYASHGRNGDFAVREPMTLGHELAGEVLAVGSDVSSGDRGITAGALVAVDPSRHCGACPRCAEGRINLCEDAYFMGSASRLPHMAGGFAGMFDVTPEQCVVVPGGVAPEAAALAEPLAVALHAVSRAGPVVGDDVLVLGAGAIGLLVAMVARQRGAAAVTLVDIAPASLERARALGFTTLDPGPAAGGAAGSGFDVAFEAAGAPAALGDAIELSRRGGRIVQIGNIGGGAVPIHANKIMAKELTLLGAFRFGAFREAVGLIVSGAIDPLALVTARRPLANAAEAFALARDRARSTKVMLIEL